MTSWLSSGHPMLSKAFPMSTVFTMGPYPSIAIDHINYIALEWLPVVFRAMAVLVASPIIILTMLDIAAYMIARTLGHPHPKPLDPSTISTASKPIKINTSKVLDISKDDIPSILISSNTPTSTSRPMTIEVTSGSDDMEFPHHFTSPSEGIFALSGEGVFSPPISRSNSPPVERNRRRRSQSNATTSDDGESDRSSLLGVEGKRHSSTSPESDQPKSSTISQSKVLRHRKNPGFQFTPMN